MKSHIEAIPRSLESSTWPSSRLLPVWWLVGSLWKIQAMGVCFILSILPLTAEVRLHPLFSDHMVLQRDQAVPVWGTAAPGEKIGVEFAGQKLSAEADAEGKWSVSLAPMPANAEPQILRVTGSTTREVKDVLMGDVWLASGQSNMASPLSSGAAAEALPAAADPLLRFYTVVKSVAAAPLAEPRGAWVLSDPAAARDFSAVAYFFAREIRRTQKVPVAVIASAWGGTPIQTWMSMESIRQDPPIAKTLALWDESYAKHLTNKDNPELMQTYYQDQKEWDEKVNPAWRAARKAHDEEMDKRRAAGLPMLPGPKPERPEPEVPDPMAMPAPSKRPSTPTITYNAMIAPLVPYGLRGILWYQGEADASRGPEYRVWLPRLIQGWRTAWGGKEIPFLIVQLPANGKDPKPVADVGIPYTREAQASALVLPQTGMTVTLDIGNPNDVHPDNKLHVGQRLALVGRQLVYGETITASGPVYDGHTVVGGKVLLQFKHTGEGLVMGQAPWRPAGSAPVPTDRLRGFFIAGSDRRWMAAEAVIEGDKVVVSSSQVSAPEAVRYGWANSPEVNLYNKEGLPAAPFRTDNW